MTRQTILTTTLVLVISHATSALQRASADIISSSDNFDSSHTYWNGSSTDVSGTIWTGVQGTGFANPIDANVTNAGRLSISQGSSASNGSNAPFNVAALYRDVLGDFDARVEMPSLPADTSFLTLSLAAWSADQANAVHIDNIRGTTNRVRFRDLSAPDEFGLAIANPAWFRLEREGDDFTAYYGSDGINWTTIGTINRAYGDTLRVGLAAWDLNGNAFVAQFDNFQLSVVVVPEPSTALLLLVGLPLVEGVVRRQRRHNRK